MVQCSTGCWSDAKEIYVHLSHELMRSFLLMDAREVISVKEVDIHSFAKTE
jgi:hypothetical protein